MTTTTTTTTNPFTPSQAMFIWGEVGRAQYVGRPHVWEDVFGQNEFTPASYFARSEPGGEMPQLLIALSVRGTFTATVTLQRSTDGGTTWQDVETYTAPVEKSIANPDQSFMWRLGVKTGDFTSGQAICILSQ